MGDIMRCCEHQQIYINTSETTHAYTHITVQVADVLGCPPQKALLCVSIKILNQMVQLLVQRRRQRKWTHKHLVGPAF
jgi:hypothetical protein